MSKSDSSQKPKRTKRWEHMPKLDIRLPDAEPEPAPRLAKTPADEPNNEIVLIDYPLLRILLRDKAYTFRTKYRQTDAASLLDTTDRTLRGWTSKDLIPYHREPGGTPYFSPQDIEDILVGSSRNGKEAR